MLKAADIMTTDVATIRSGATVAEAVKLMQTSCWHALIVERRSDQDAYGIITFSDIVYKVIALGKDPAKVSVYEIMSKPCIVVNPDLDVEYVARLFAEHHLLRAPVIQGELMGIISLVDIINESKFLELPRVALLEQELQDAIKNTRIAKKISNTALEEYSQELPEEIDWCKYDALYS
ncbi:MAG: CBS domain-containing protein [Rivularia sp. (in: cyanobacteria)]|jgi:CBS domain-containing protein